MFINIIITIIILFYLDTLGMQTTSIPTYLVRTYDYTWYFGSLDAQVVIMSTTNMMQIWSDILYGLSPSPIRISDVIFPTTYESRSSMDQRSMRIHVPLPHYIPRYHIVFVSQDCHS